MTQQNQRFEDRERLNSELFGVYIAPLTQEQQNMLLSNQDYVNNYNALQSMVQAEVLNLVRGKIEASADGKHLLEEQLKLVKLLKSKIVEVTNKEMELFKAFFYLSKF